MKKVEYIVMDYSELDELVTKTYGREYEVVGEEECENDTCLARDDIKRESLDKWDMQCLRQWIDRERDQAPGLYCLLADMVNNGIIEEGNYLIKISW